MNAEKHVRFLERELEVLASQTEAQFQSGESGTPEHEIRLKELALKSAIAFYKGESIDSVNKIGEFELFLFLNYFKKAISMTTLTPIEEDNYWTEVMPGMYRNERFLTLTKLENKETGEILYADDGRFVVCNIRNLSRRMPDYKELEVLMDLYPITFPYTPLEKPIILYVDEGEFTKHILYGLYPDGNMTQIKRVFRKNGNDWNELK